MPDVASDNRLPCISCRLRRKKCDKAHPVCGRCQHLGIPAEWCLYIGNVGLQDKDSAATLDREKLRNMELVQQRAHFQKLVQYIEKSRLEDAQLDNSPPKQVQRRPFHDGDRDFGFCLGLISTPQDLQWPPALSIFKVLKQERERYIKEKIPRPTLPQAALEEFENKWNAVKVGAQVTNAEQIITAVLEELTHTIPTKDYYEFFWNATRSQNTARFVAGLPYMHPEMLELVQGAIHFDDKGRAFIPITSARDGRKLVYLAMALTVISIGHFIESRRLTEERRFLSAEEHWKYTLCIKYADALIRASDLNPSLALDADEPSVILTVAMYQLHLFNKYTASISFSGELNNPEHTALTTRYLIHRCQRLHFHQNLYAFYDDMTEEKEKTLKSVWYGLVLLEVVDTLNFGVMSSIQPGQFAYEPPAAYKSPICDALRVIHGVVDDLNLLDGELNTNVMLEAAEDSLKELQRVFHSLGATWEQGVADIQILNVRGALEDPLVNKKFFGACERYAMLGIIMGISLCVCTMSLRAMETVGETPLLSERAYNTYLRTLKYTVLLLQHFRLFIEMTYNVGNDVENVMAQMSLLCANHFGTPGEFCGIRRAVCWVGSVMSKVMDLSDEECINFILHHHDDLREDRAIVDVLRRRYGKEIPQFADLMNFEIDWDPVLLKEKFNRLADEKVITTILASEFVMVREMLTSKTISLGFLKMTEAFAFGSRYTSLGIRYFFPDVVRGLDSKKTPVEPTTPVNVVEPGGQAGVGGEGAHEVVDFGGTFRELFDQVIDTSIKEFTFGAFFGGDYEQ